MARKKDRISLKDLKRSDEVEEKIDSSVGDKKIIHHTTTSSNIDTNLVSPKINKLATGEYEKLSVSIPIDIFETLQDISRERRRIKQKHTMSQMVREALDLWLEQRNQTSSI